MFYQVEKSIIRLMRRRLLREYYGSPDTDRETSVSASDIGGQNISPEIILNFKREILLSYRVIFGQHRASRRLYKSQKWSVSNASLDPILLQLCTYSLSEINNTLPHFIFPESCRNFDGLEFGPLQELDVYSVGIDFPLLGHRFRKLEEFSLRQSPSRLRDVWRDFRSPLQWYTFWAVIAFGIAAVLLGIIQVIISAGQLALAIKPQN